MGLLEFPDQSIYLGKVPSLGLGNRGMPPRPLEDPPESGVRCLVDTLLEELILCSDINCPICVALADSVAGDSKDTLASPRPATGLE